MCSLGVSILAFFSCTLASYASVLTTRKDISITAWSLVSWLTKWTLKHSKFPFVPSPLSGSVKMDDNDNVIMQTCVVFVCLFIALPVGSYFKLYPSYTVVEWPLQNTWPVSWRVTPAQHQAWAVKNGLSEFVHRKCLPGYGEDVRKRVRKWG